MMADPTDWRKKYEEAEGRNEVIARDRDMWRSQKDALAVRLNRQDRSIEQYQEIEKDRDAALRELAQHREALARTRNAIDRWHAERDAALTEVARLREAVAYYASDDPALDPQ